jgi:hypothetical protein
VVLLGCAAGGRGAPRATLANVPAPSPTEQTSLGIELVLPLQRDTTLNLSYPGGDPQIESQPQTREDS